MAAITIEKPVEINREQNLKDHRLYWIDRRTQDVILSALALVVLSPVMLATAIAIVVDDPSAGPVFSQERMQVHKKLMLQIMSERITAHHLHSTACGAVKSLV